MLRVCLAALAAAALIGLDEEPPPVGMDVLPLVRAAAAAVAPPAAPVAGRPWSDELAALTSDDPAVSAPAVGALVRRGEAVLPDLAVLSADRDWQVRSRVVRVAAGIGGTAGAPLVLDLSRDPDARVRRMAVVGLGRCRGEAVFQRLAEQLASADGEDRALAAPSLAALGDVRGIGLLGRMHRDADSPARQAAAQALRSLCARPEALPAIVALLGGEGTDSRRAVLEALAGATDVRLSPALAALIDDREPLAVLLAVRALATAGDARAVPALVGLAVSPRRDELRAAAATALQALTGYRAAEGQAWAIWWSNNQARWTALAARDGQIATLYDPAADLPAGLAALAPDDLAPLVDLAIGARPAPPWVPARALAVLRRQAGEPWALALGAAIDQAGDGDLRLDLILLLDAIGGPRAREQLLRLQAEVERREAAALARWDRDGAVPPDFGAERELIAQALARR